MSVRTSPSVRLPSVRSLGSLRYQAEAGRDFRFDFLRGFAVFAMVVDHIAGPSRLYWLTGGNRFYTSAAEGFVFISGLIVGMVYRRIAERDGLNAALRRLVERAWQLYVLSVGLTLLVLPISETLNLPWAQGIDLRDPALLVWNILLLRQTYYLVDIPLLYALLLAVAPLGLLLLHERRTWVLLAASWFLWAGHQIFPLRTEFPWPIAGNYLFYFSAWQVLFFTAMVIGYHQERVGQAISPRWQQPLLLLTALGFALLLVLFRYTEPILQALTSSGEALLQAGPPLEARLVEVVFAKGDARIGRLLASAVVFGFLFLLVTELWRPLKALLGWFLVPLGQNALYAYSAHIVVALAFGLLAAQTQFPMARSSTANAAVQVLTLMLIWAGIKTRFLIPRKEHLRYWMAGTAVLAIAVLTVLPADPSPQLPGLGPAPAAETEARARVARVFGTPVPRMKPEQRAIEAARIGITPVPLPPPPPPPVLQERVREPAPQGLPAPAPLSALSDYVGPISGTLREYFFYSPALDRDMSYYIYLPPDYGTAGRRYPVMYMLHGGGGDKDEWPAYGLIDTADQLIDTRQIRPLILVLPQGDYGYWVNNVEDGPRWGDYVSFDLVRHIDSSFRTLPDPEHRGVAGLSMGGYGALYLSFTNPHVFRVVGAHSPSLRAEEELEELATILGTGDDFARRDVMQIAKTARNLDVLQLWIDLGEDDPWLDRAIQLHELLEQRGIDHEFHNLPGDHSGDYWQANLVTYLTYYDRTLNWAYD